jgi:hypothetical protein
MAIQHDQDPSTAVSCELITDKSMNFMPDGAAAAKTVGAAQRCLHHRASAGESHPPIRSPRTTYVSRPSHEAGCLYGPTLYGVLTTEHYKRHRYHHR